MPGPPPARMLDLHMGVCTLGTPMLIMPPCAVTVLVGKRPTARMGDLCMGLVATPVGPVPMPPHPLLKGSMTVLVNKRPMVRLSDSCLLGGIVTLGEVTVLAGG